jgi:hypothetical protein
MLNAVMARFLTGVDAIGGEPLSRQRCIDMPGKPGKMYNIVDKKSPDSDLLSDKGNNAQPNNIVEEHGRRWAEVDHSPTICLVRALAGAEAQSPPPELHRSSWEVEC